MAKRKTVDLIKLKSKLNREITADDFRIKVEILFNGDGAEIARTITVIPSDVVAFCGEKIKEEFKDPSSAQLWIASTVDFLGDEEE